MRLSRHCRDNCLGNLLIKDDLGYCPLETAILFQCSSAVKTLMSHMDALQFKSVEEGALSLAIVSCRNADVLAAQSFLHVGIETPHGD